MNREAIDLPCNGCTVCCKADMVFIHPECGDRAKDYKTELLPDGRRMLKHKPNGDCVYLEARGCSIHGRRPVVCGELDCRTFLARPELRPMFPGKRWRAMLKAARRLDRRIGVATEGDLTTR